MARRIDWNYRPRSTRWKSSTTSGKWSVDDMIRKNNHGFKASEISAGSAPGGGSVFTPGAYSDQMMVGSRRRVPYGSGLSLRKPFVGGMTTVSRGPGGRPLRDGEESTAGTGKLGSYGTAGGSGTGRYSDGSPVPGALKRNMTYAERFPGTQNWLESTFGKQARDGLEGAIGRLPQGSTVNGMPAGDAADAVRNGAGWQSVSVPYSPMAVPPGQGDGAGAMWDVIRAGIHDKSVRDTIRKAGNNPLYGEGVDLADANDVTAKTAAFNEQLKVNKEANADQFVRGVVSSLESQIEKETPPSGPKPSETAAEASARHDAARASGDVGAMKSSFDEWRKAVEATPEAREANRARHAADAARTKAQWDEVNALEKQLNATRGAVYGGASREVTLREDRFLDELIGEMEA